MSRISYPSAASEAPLLYLVVAKILMVKFGDRWGEDLKNTSAVLAPEWETAAWQVGRLIELISTDVDKYTAAIDVISRILTSPTTTGLDDLIQYLSFDRTNSEFKYTYQAIKEFEKTRNIDIAHQILAMNASSWNSILIAAADFHRKQSEWFSKRADDVERFKKEAHDRLFQDHRP